LIPASILAGVAASCLWAAKCVYITESAVKYAKLNVESSGTVIPRFNEKKIFPEMYEIL
jgi:hypothetical protein